ncbi:DUF1439 domain-containing protein [Massilia glaciei]|uniref:DUF1439 domain-containing protein n=1 Tax=Massilia glaciei TaxID=1524097 RepID=A0A2U2I670_9BURK|nr:DUF1439 domain-containing protein [Massilia glaciei]PWF55253.1 DUF1439 domain-containing protein [Massilia glaciei]
MNPSTAAARQPPLRWAAFALLFCALLAGCASIVGPREISLPLSRLQEGLERRFPVQNRMLELFDVQLTRPQLSILDDSGRVALGMDASFAPAFLRKAWRGRMALSGRLEVDPTRNAIFMRDARIDQFVVDGIDPAQQRMLVRVADLLMEQLTRDLPLYRFRPEDVRYAGMQFTPTRIATTPRGLVVTIEPEK